MRGNSFCIVFIGLWLVSVSSQDCKSVVEQHLRNRTKEAVPYSSDSMVFFLHVPRTAGRTFHTCLLKPGTPEDRRCPRAYDHLRLTGDINCKLVASHDDFSLVDIMSKGVTVVTQMRDPVDRFLSAYEFAVELATRAAYRKRPVRKRPGRIATDEVWPWSYFIPWFKNDIQQRAAKLSTEPQPKEGVWVEMEAEDGRVYHLNKQLNITRWPEKGVDYSDVLPALDPYNNPLVMPLEEFIKHPIAKELLHEGGLLQVLGVTNYSHYSEAHAVRQCVFSDPEAHQLLLQAALKRLDTFAHVGIMDRLDDSVRSAAASLDLRLDEPAFAPKAVQAQAGQNPAQQGGARQVLSQEAAAGQQLKAGDGPLWHGDDDLEEDDDGAGDADAADDVDGAEAGSADATGDGQQQRDVAAEELAQATRKLEDAHNKLQTTIQAGGSSEELQHGRQLLDEAKDGLRSAQDALLAARSVPPARQLMQIKDEQGRLRTRDKLAGFYRRCMARAHGVNKRRKRMSMAQLQMPDGRSVKFSKAARARLPEHIIKAIRDLNPGDMALHKKAQGMLQEQLQRHEQKGVLKQLPPMPRRPTPLEQRRQQLDAGKQTSTTNSER